MFGLALSYKDDNRTIEYFSYAINLPKWVSQSSFTFQNRQRVLWKQIDFKLNFTCIERGTLQTTTYFKG